MTNRRWLPFCGLLKLAHTEDQFGGKVFVNKEIWHPMMNQLLFKGAFGGNVAVKKKHVQKVVRFFIEGGQALALR